MGWFGVDHSAPICKGGRFQREANVGVGRMGDERRKWNDMK